MNLQTSFPSTINQNLKESFQLFLACEGLPCSSSFVQLSMSFQGCEPAVLDCTETIPDSADPNYLKALMVEYHFEVRQTIVLDVYSAKENNDKEIIGSVSFPMAHLMIAPAEGLVLELVTNKDKSPTITIKKEKLGNCNKKYHFKVNCSNVKDIEFITKSDPFIRIYRPSQEYESAEMGSDVPDDGWVLVHETEFYRNNLNPSYKPFTILSSVLNKDQPRMPNRWEIWDYEKSMKHRFLGRVDFACSSLIDGFQTFHTRDSKGKSSGDIHFEEFSQQTEYSVSQYLEAGLRPGLVVGIDFTMSNGVPQFPSSLHYTAPGFINQYMQAIIQVCSVLMEYDEDKLVPVFGFGAKLPSLSKETLFCFPLNKNVENPFVHSMLGILGVYRTILPTLEFSGPTNFAPLLNQTKKAIEEQYEADPLIYTLLLILTDGLCTDMQETIDLLVELADLPLSVIIVGIGDEDFSLMEVLDADDKPLVSTEGKEASRDLVQFVPYNKYAANPAQLASEVLQEVPAQIDQFYQSIGLDPTKK